MHMWTEQLADLLAEGFEGKATSYKAAAVRATEAGQAMAIDLLTPDFIAYQPCARLRPAILPVFFGQALACVVTDRALQTHGELNPQIARELIVVARSPGLLPTLLSFGPACYDPLRTLMLRSIATLREKPQGRHVLELFGQSDVRPVRDTAYEALASVQAHP